MTGVQTCALPIFLLHSTLPRFEDLAFSAGFGIVVFVAGGLFFRYMKRGFADVL